MRCLIDFALGSFAAAVIGGLVTGCAEAVGTGMPVKIPKVVVDCTTSQCLTNSSPYIFTWVTPASCDFRLIDNAIASTSVTASCDSSSGCRVTLPTSWLLGSSYQASATLPSGTYTICGRINYSRTLPASIGSNDTTIEIPSVNFVDGMGPVALGGAGSIGTWIDP